MAGRSLSAAAAVGGRAAEPSPRVRSSIDHTCPRSFLPSVRTHVVAVCVGSVLQTVLDDQTNSQRQAVSPPVSAAVRVKEPTSTAQSRFNAN